MVDRILKSDYYYYSMTPCLVGLHGSEVVAPMRKLHCSVNARTEVTSCLFCVTRITRLPSICCQDQGG